MPNATARRTVRAAFFAAALVTTSVAHAQSALSARTPRAAAPVAANRDSSDADALADDAVLRDTLFTGITLTRTQAQLIVSIARDQRLEQEADRPVFMDAVSEIRRARDRGDTTGARRALELVQQSANLRRAWWMGAMRAVLTPTQRRHFDANLAATSDQPDVVGAALAHGERW